MRGSEIQPDSVQVRPAQSEDAAFVHALYANPLVTRTLLRIRGPVSRNRARQICEAVDTSEFGRCYVAQLPEQRVFVGIGTIHRHDHGVSIGYSVEPLYWHRGIGTAIATALVALARAPGGTKISATTLVENKASARILERLGFRRAHTIADEADATGVLRQVYRWRLEIADAHGPSAR
ncbi:MAG: GNAT family N-acetyltransferase [Pseudomonadota bacterium]